MRASELRALFFREFAGELLARYGLRRAKYGYSRKINEDIEVELSDNNRLWGGEGVEIGINVKVRSLSIEKFIKTSGVLPLAQTKHAATHAATLAIQIGCLEDKKRSRHWDVGSKEDIPGTISSICQSVDRHALRLWGMCSGVDGCLQMVDAVSEVFTNEEYFVPVALLLLNRKDRARMSLEEYHNGGKRHGYSGFRQALLAHLD